MTGRPPWLILTFTCWGTMSTGSRDFLDMLSTWAARLFTVPERSSIRALIPSRLASRSCIEYRSCVIAGSSWAGPAGPASRGADRGRGGVAGFETAGSASDSLNSATTSSSSGIVLTLGAAPPLPGLSLSLAISSGLIKDALLDNLANTCSSLVSSASE